MQLFEKLLIGMAAELVGIQPETLRCIAGRDGEEKRATTSSRWVSFFVRTARTCNALHSNHFREIGGRKGEFGEFFSSLRAQEAREREEPSCVKLPEGNSPNSPCVHKWLKNTGRCGEF